MTQKLYMLRLAAAAGAIAIAAPLAGCGGSSNNNDTIITTQQADPYIYAYGDNGLSAAYGPDEVSAFGTGTTGNPAATDALYFTFASANSAPTDTESGAGTFETGTAFGMEQTTDASGNTVVVGSYVEGTSVPAIPAGDANVIFRAQGVQGQLSNRTVPDIKTATLAIDGGTASSLLFTQGYDQNTAAGPFAASPYYIPASFSSITTSGVYSAAATITDSANQTTTTTFQTVVLAGTDSAISSSMGAITFTDGTVPTYTYGPDASGTSVVIVPPGTYAISVNGFASTATTTTGTVYIAPTAAPAAAAARHRMKHAHKVSV